MTDTDGIRAMLAELRSRVAFEHMLMSVLASAALSGLAVFGYDNLAAMARGGWSLAAVLPIALGAVWVVFLVFLIGFGATVAVGTPLHMALERARYRRLWPYLLVALAIQYLALLLLAGPPPLLDKPQTVVLLLPGAMAALFFWLRIRPVWRAAEAEDREQPPVVRYLH